MVERKSRISYECHPDLLLESLFEDDDSDYSVEHEDEDCDVVDPIMQLMYRYSTARWEGKCSKCGNDADHRGDFACQVPNVNVNNMNNTVNVLDWSFSFYPNTPSQPWHAHNQGNTIWEGHATSVSVIATNPDTIKS